MLKFVRKIKFLLVALLFVAAMLFVPSWQTSSQSFALDSEAVLSENGIAKLINVQRVENGLTPLKRNALLDLAAQRKAQNMVAEGYWAHFSPKGVSPWSFILGAGYKYRYAGENLAKSVTTSGQTVDLWMGSPLHKKNILNSNYKDVGYAVYEGDYMGINTTLVVQMFGATN